METTFKVCLNCGTQTGLRRRTCPACGKGTGRGFFRSPTEAEIKVRVETAEKNENLLNELLNGG